MASAELAPSNTGLGERFRAAVEELGDWALFALQTLAWCFRRRPVRGTLLANVYAVGVKTAPVVLVTGLFIGMVLAVNSYAVFNAMNMASRMGASNNLGLVRELGPVLVATMLAGRVGSAMAAELATMKITEQVDALACLGVNPVHYLVVPRVLACVLIIPLLTVLANFMGVMGGAFISLNVFGIDPHHYWQHAGDSVGWWDLLTGLVKPLFFGAAISLISCHRGLNAKSGAEGVGRAATEAFVVSFVAVLVLDFFLALLLQSLDLLIWGDVVNPITG